MRSLPSLLRGIVILAPVLQYIFNVSSMISRFLSAQKNAVVVPVHKSGSFSCVDNYRPIALLPASSKVFEKVFFLSI